jgi:DNA-binding transcriptional LysR family regulator
VSLDRLTSMAAFVRVVEAGSLRSASAQLNMSPQMVGQHIRFLEKSLGATLLTRTTRTQSLTEVGQAYFERCRIVLAEVEVADAVGADHGAEPRGCIRISAPVTYGTHVLMPVLAAYLRRYPGVELNIDLSDRLISQVSERVEVVFRLGSLEDSSLVARRLSDYRLILSAAPAYLEANGVPQTPSDLLRHACLTFSFASGAAWHEWRFTRAGAEDVIEIRPRLLASDGRALVEAACNGVGVVIGAEILVDAEIAAGRLVRLLPDWNCPPRPVHMLFAPDRHQTRKLRSFIDFVASSLGP